MNKSESKKEAERVMKGFLEVMSRNLGKEIDSLGYVLYDHEVPQSIKQQKPIILSQPDGRTARDIRALAVALLEVPEKRERPGPANPLARLFSRVLGAREREC
jgi:MinD-like ATPase involved in chromosome partitioning or flagellar assembly